MSTNNPNTLAPSLPFPERGRVVVDVQLAQNTRRRGSLQAEEGLGWEQPYPGAFHESVMKSDDAANHAAYETQLAGQANGRGRLGSGQEVPAWNAVDNATRAGFLQGTAGTEQSASRLPMMHEPRLGANASPLGPTYGFNVESVPGNIYAKKTAPPNGGRRRNQADVTDL